MLKYAVLILWKKGIPANFYAFCISGLHPKNEHKIFKISHPKVVKLKEVSVFGLGHPKSHIRTTENALNSPNIAGGTTDCVFYLPNHH